MEKMQQKIPAKLLNSDFNLLAGIFLPVEARAYHHHNQSTYGHFSWLRNIHLFRYFNLGDFFK